jgi:cell division protein FtsN
MTTSNIGPFKKMIQYNIMSAIIIGVVVIILIAVAVIVFLNKEKILKMTAPTTTPTLGPTPGPTTTTTPTPPVDPYDRLSDSIGNKISDL